ncbi:NAD(P)/FAD-dependent oxidoreductase [Lyngbya sp. PCC 8106]|uniref:NAD(P)/FAD-dependent oxidoreductase n=1 Tax=Lyngbya sp. (strain PCC 8106) TaxID=313612 RepID=UPI0000EAB1F8|nr:NAD(P)/FAD-dependent oxidoreductase [Lyngbya sp. PCC 8106]EAW35767.1 Fumarate reductase/succinate dehydrogenase flavoprotein-like protein [Lyngbya sp. PCC 8106]
MSKLNSIKVVVIGGGAAGFFGAISCANTHPHAEVILLEAGQQLLAKVRISGGGRCNVTHACFEPSQFVQNYPRGGKALRGAFSRFQAKDTVEWFTQKGVTLKTEEDGRMFPITDNSETIVNCLIDAAKQAGVQIKTQARVTDIKVKQDDKSRFKITLKSGEILTADRLLLATGSNPSGYHWAEQLGHKIIPPVPSLFTFNINDERLKDLAGVSVNHTKIKLPKAKLEQTGPLLVTHWGLSGPAVLKLSAWGARFLQDCRYQTSLIINWLPQSNPEVLREELLAVKSQLPQRVISASCPVMIPRRLWKQLTLAVGIDEQKRWGEVSNKVINQLIPELTQGEYKINGKGVFKEEFVTCGGVSLKEVNFKTMESRCCPNLYFAGEILDIDGVTGGFNFQSAWTTGWLAGQAMGKP